MPVNNQQYRGEIGVFHNKLCVIKCCYIFLDFYKCYSDRAFDFESLFMVLDLLASFHFESLFYYVIIILQSIRRVNFNSLTFSYIFQVLTFHSQFYFYSRLIELSGDVEKDPRPNSKPDRSFSIYHWNLNGITAHNFSKIQSLIAYNWIYHFDIICLSKKYLNSYISFDNENLDIPGYRLIRSDHPSDDKRGGVCVYFKFSLYSYPSQNMEEFETFVKNLELNIELSYWGL